MGGNEDDSTARGRASLRRGGNVASGVRDQFAYRHLSNVRDKFIQALVQPAPTTHRPVISEGRDMRTRSRSASPDARARRAGRQINAPAALPPLKTLTDLTAPDRNPTMRARMGLMMRAPSLSQSEKSLSRLVRQGLEGSTSPGDRLRAKTAALRPRSWSVAPAHKLSPSESTTAGTRSEMSLVARIDTDSDALMLKIRRQTTRLFTKMFAGLSGQHLDREIECTLRNFDKNKDSCLDRDEFAMAFHDTGLILTTAELYQMFAEADRDGNGTVDLEKCCLMVSRRRVGC